MEVEPGSFPVVKVSAVVDLSGRTWDLWSGDGYRWVRDDGSARSGLFAWTDDGLDQAFAWLADPAAIINRVTFAGTVIFDQVCLEVEQ